MDLNKINIQKRYVEKPSHPYRPLQGELFLRGPIPLKWLTHSLTVGSCGYRLGLYIWFCVGITRALTFRLNLSDEKLALFGLNRTSASKALKKLEALQLIQIKRKPGSVSTIVVVL